MVGDASCKTGRDPKDRSTLLFLAALQKLHLTFIFPKVKQPFLLLGKWDPGTINVPIKRKWIWWFWSESLNFAQNNLAHALEICSATGTIPQQGFTPLLSLASPPGSAVELQLSFVIVAAVWDISFCLWAQEGKFSLQRSLQPWN